MGLQTLGYIHDARDAKPQVPARQMGLQAPSCRNMVLGLTRARGCKPRRAGLLNRAQWLHTQVLGVDHHEWQNQSAWLKTQTSGSANPRVWSLQAHSQLQTHASRVAEPVAQVCRTPHLGVHNREWGSDPPPWYFLPCMGSTDPFRGCIPTQLGMPGFCSAKSGVCRLPQGQQTCATGSIDPVQKKK